MMKKIIILALALALLATSVARVLLVNENRSEVRVLFDLRAKQEQLLKENNSLVLEQSVLSRTARLQKLARDRLGMRKPAQVRQLKSN